jgi:hypothetical protein
MVETFTTRHSEADGVHYYKSDNSTISLLLGAIRYTALYKDNERGEKPKPATV